MGFQNVFGHKQKIGFAALSGPPAPVYGPYTIAFAAVVVSRGGVVTTAEKAYLTTFENSVGTDLAEFDRLFIHGLTSSIAARTSFVNPSTTAITAVNSPLFTPGVGYTGNGTSAYLNHNVQESALVKYTQTSNSFFLYCNSNITEIVNEYGVYDPTSAIITACIVNHPSLAYLTDNNFTSSISQTSNLNSVGLFQCKRVGNQVDNYFNGAIFISSAALAQPLQNLNIYSLCRNNRVNGAEVFTNKQHCLIGYGSGAINSTNFNNAVQNLSSSLKWRNLQQTVAAYGGVSTNTTLPTNITGAKLIVVTVQSYKLAGVPSIIDNLGNTYTNVAYISGASAPSISTFYCINPVTSTAQTFTANSPGGYPAISVNIFTGANFAFDGYTSNTGGSSTSLNTGLITPASTRNLLITGINYWIGDAPNGISDSFIITNNTPATPTTLAGSTAYKFDSPAVDPLWNWTGLSGETAVMITSFTY